MGINLIRNANFSKGMQGWSGSFDLVDDSSVLGGQLAMLDADSTSLKNETLLSAGDYKVQVWATQDTEATPTFWDELQNTDGAVLDIVDSNIDTDTGYTLYRANIIIPVEMSVFDVIAPTQVGTDNKTTIAGVKAEQDTEFTAFSLNPEDEVISVSSIEILNTETSINVGENLVLNHSITPSDATNKNVDYSSSDENILSINEDTVTGISEGVATITATTEDGGYTDSIEISINNVPSEQDENNGRKKIMSNLKLGIKEVADVTFYDIATGRPVLLFDTLKVSNLENASESATATGGKGNGTLRSWDYGRTATLTMQDALISEKSLSMLAGSNLGDAVTEGKRIYRTETILVGTDGAIETANVPAGAVTAYTEDMDAEVVITDTDGVLTADAEAGDRIKVFYETEAEEGSTLITFSSDKFPSTYRVVATGLGRDSQGVDHVIQFQIPKAKLQSNFTFTMDPENVSTFDFNLEILADESKEMYSIIRV